MTERQEQKAKALAALRQRVPRCAERLGDIDPRLAAYFQGLCDHASAEPADEDDLHNYYEILGGLKFLRMLYDYTFNTKIVKAIIRMGEGEWQQDGKMWRHIGGGIRQPGTRGAQVYRWQPFQVFILSAMYGFYTLIDTRTEAGTRELLPTEQVVDGNIFDFRRVCTRFTYYGPRKTNKTGLSAFGGVIDFTMGDYDGECYCCANSQQQSKIIYDRIQGMLRTLDPEGKRIRYTATQTNWKPGQPRRAKVEALSAGGKTKDGLFASYCAKDEIGSSSYTNGKSDMGGLVNVIESSMGPRRNPMSVTTTTAGTIQTGPFMEELQQIRMVLELEMDYIEGKATPLLANDRTACLLLEPDEWEMDEEVMFTKQSVRAKVNPMLGIIVQHSFYEQEIAASRMDELKRIETITKLFNVYMQGKVTEWLKPDDIRHIQTGRIIDDCKADDGWVVLCGMDFSKGDDLHAVTYLAVRQNPRGGTEFFADMDAWVTERALHESSIRTLLEKWVSEGWLHVCPGAVLQPSLPVDRIVDLIENHGVSFIRWGYDAYQSKDPINTLKSYLWEVKGVNPDTYVVPVSQTFASYNPAVLKLEAVIFSEPAMLSLSANPMWPWEFGNCVIAEDSRMNNRKMIKRNPGSDACKVDNVQCLATCFILLEQIEGHLQLT